VEGDQGGVARDSGLAEQSDKSGIGRIRKKSPNIHLHLDGGITRESMRTRSSSRRRRRRRRGRRGRGRSRGRRRRRRLLQFDSNKLNGSEEFLSFMFGRNAVEDAALITSNRGVGGKLQNTRDPLADRVVEDGRRLLRNGEFSIDVNAKGFVDGDNQILRGGPNAAEDVVVEPHKIIGIFTQSKSFIQRGAAFYGVNDTLVDIIAGIP
jgi:hypothetical protein